MTEDLTNKIRLLFNDLISAQKENDDKLIFKIKNQLEVLEQKFLDLGGYVDTTREELLIHYPKD